MLENDPRPPHEQITADLRAKIMDGTIAGQLPTTEQLKRLYGVTNATVTKIVSTLRDEGLIFSVRGRYGAVYVSDQARGDATAAEAYRETSPSLHYGDHLVTVAKPPGDVGEILGVDQTVCRSRTTYVDRIPVELSESHMPVAFARELGLDHPRKVRGGIRSVLAAAQLPVRRFVDEVSARQPTSSELKLLDLPAGVPVLRILRTLYTDDDRIVGVDVLVKGAHRYRERYEIAAS